MRCPGNCRSLTRIPLGGRTGSTHTPLHRFKQPQFLLAMKLMQGPCKGVPGALIRQDRPQHPGKPHKVHTTTWLQTRPDLCLHQPPSELPRPAQAASHLGPDPLESTRVSKVKNGGQNAGQVVSPFAAALPVSIHLDEVLPSGLGRPSQSDELTRPRHRLHIASGTDMSPAVCTAHNIHTNRMTCGIHGSSIITPHSPECLVTPCTSDV